MENSKDKKCACEKKENGLKKGILYGLLPHSFCILFIIFSVLSITAFSSLFRPFLSGRYSFVILAVLSLILATISAVIYLRKNQALSFAGAKSKWKYLSSLYGSVVIVNLLMIYLIFPALANTNFKTNFSDAASLSQNYSLVSLKVDIPCSGHSYLIIDEFKNVNGIKDVRFRLPNLFDVYFDSQIVNQEQILSLKIFKDFPAAKVGN